MLFMERKLCDEFRSITAIGAKEIYSPKAMDVAAFGEGSIGTKAPFSHWTGPAIMYASVLLGKSCLEVQVANPKELGLLPVGTKVGLRLYRKSLHLLKKEL